jgi:hypothetical protein
LLVTTGLHLRKETAVEKTNPRGFADAGIFIEFLGSGKKGKQVDKASNNEVI